MSRLKHFQDREIEAARAAGAEMFLGIPDAWYEPPHWGCENGHVARAYLKSEARGANLCLACHEPIAIIPPGYTDATLAAALAKETP